MKSMYMLGGALLAALAVQKPSTCLARDLQKDVNQAT